MRILFPFTMGMFLSRIFKPIKVRGAFWICSAVLLALFSVPYLEGTEPISMNGLFEMFCVIVVFPCSYLAGSIGKYYRQEFDKDMQVPGRHFLPALHHPLSVYVPVLCLVDREATLHVRRNLASGIVRLYRLHHYRLSLFETV